MARTERFVPAKSRVAVRQAGKPAVWYTTQKDVIVTSDAPATCPMTGATDNVRSTVEQGVTVWFTARMVRSRIVLESGDVDPKAFNQQFSSFVYDVPNHVIDPCPELYRVAVRRSESEWLVLAGDIPWDLKGRMEDLGCIVNCDPYDVKATASLLHQAVGQLQKKMDEKLASAERSYANARAQLDNSADPEHDDYLADEAEALKRFNRRIATIEKSLNELATAINEGATKCGISERAYGRTRLHGMAALTRTNGTAKARAYHRATQIAAASTDLNLAALAHDAAQSQISALVLAGALEDAGHDAAAKALADAFTESETAGTTFSLTGDDEHTAV